MGNAEGDFRGGNDVVLTNAIENMSDDEVNQAIAYFSKNGVFKASGLEEGSVTSKFDLLTNLDKFPEDTKEDIIAAMKNGENPFE